MGDRVQSLGWEDPLEKGKATHSSILAWRTPWTEETGGLQSMGKWQPTPVFLPGESQGRGSLVGCRLWGYSHSIAFLYFFALISEEVFIISPCYSLELCASPERPSTASAILPRARRATALIRKAETELSLQRSSKS